MPSRATKPLESFPPYHEMQSEFDPSAWMDEEEILFDAIHDFSEEENDNDERQSKKPRREINHTVRADSRNQLTTTSSTTLTTQYPTIQIHRDKFASLVNKNKSAFKPIVRLPHVPSQDIRRSYATMWGNAFNLYDSKLLLKFLINHVRGDSTLVKAFPQGGSDLLSFPSHIQLHGKKDLLLYWLGVLLLSPDQVILHDHIRIEPRKDGQPGSKITCRLQVRGTRPYALSLAQLIDLVNNHVNNKLAIEGKAVHDLSDEEYMEVLLQLDPFQCIGDIEGEVGTMLVQSVGPLNVVGTFSFLLDSNKLIECMDYSIAPDTKEHRGYFEAEEDTHSRAK